MSEPTLQDQEMLAGLDEIRAGLPSTSPEEPKIDFRGIMNRATKREESPQAPKDVHLTSVGDGLWEDPEGNQFKVIEQRTMVPVAKNH